MLRGIATVNIYAEDLKEARRWYTELLGAEPYFAREVDGGLAYVEFRIGDFSTELGIIDARFAPQPRGTRETVSGAIAYWAVDDAEAAFTRLLELGATEHQAVRTQGPGFVTASVVDPFGNLLGVMENSHYVEVVESVR
ncbi:MULTISPECIES: VOC family protein [Arthrobacter]|uniref:VOC family protein n=2 Tax=Arthrobacter TaxID=1663 RepID=A0ABU9KK36_9MICC|nr:VOC family protein [Arthrobacter sp. YJM1]MDP5226273.1 VOC family protein [Arthrobacter sp. YJM1]